MPEYLSLDEALIEALTDYLEQRALDAPPQGCRLQIVRGGNLQADPTVKAGAYVTLHVGDPDDPAAGHEVAGGGRERYDVDGGQATLFGRERETSGGAVWIYLYTVKVDYYFTATGETRDRARAKAISLNRWLFDQIEGSGPDQLGVYRIGREVFMELHVTNVYQDEGGGPPASFIWKSRLRVKGLVHVG